MTTRTLIVRFDIDAPMDIKAIPCLLQMLAELETRAVFFVNMGRLVCRREALFGSPGRTWGNLSPGSGKIPLLSKFGWIEAVKTFVFNPLVGASQGCVLKEIAAAGHEVGLHGGMNHAVWQRRGERLSLKSIEALTGPALEAFRSALGPPAGFASPGFTSSAIIREWLARKGFQYSMDCWGEGRLPDFAKSPPDFPVTLAGPDGTPFLEYHDARGTSPPDLLRLLRKSLEKSDYACLYGHPMYEGLSRRQAFARLIMEARGTGFEVATPLELLEEVPA